MTTLKHPALIEAERRADWIADLPYVTKTVRLPDLHMKEGMEAPSSLVVATDNVIVPHLVSESINDGMGLVATQLDVEDLDADAPIEILKQVNRAGALSKAKPSRYSWTRSLLEAACREGAAPLLEHYNLKPEFLSSFEDAGSSRPRALTATEFHRAVPTFLRSTRLTRSEIGLNFAGNHFLEVQVVDETADPARCEQWGLRPGQVVVMYHLGPGPLGSILSNLHAFRAKPQFHRKVGYAFFRNLLHLGGGWRQHRTFASFDTWLTLDSNSPEGEAYATVLNVINNYGFAYRAATIAAIVDAIQEVTGAPRDSNRLVVDMSHNMLQPEPVEGTLSWVSRHNCCRPRRGMPGIVAGSHQVPSCVTVGPDDCEDRLAGYDHGVGFLIEQAKRDGRLERDERDLVTRRLLMTRGTDELHEQKVLPLLKRGPLDDAMGWLGEMSMADPIAYLRPVATLKHKP